jgi:N-acetylmuramoyl-L-alanine amidase CwlA
MPRGAHNDDPEDSLAGELLERLLVQLLIIADRCKEPATRRELMRLVDECHSARMQIDEAYAELNIVQDFIPVGKSNRPGKKLIPTAITIHNTDSAEVGANAAAYAKFQKGPDARKREVSWHFTVDDKSVYQSLPINEIGRHAGTTKGNARSIGINVCINADLDVRAAYRRAALLTAVLAFQNAIDVPKRILQHHDWSGKNCPRVLRDMPNGWQDFLTQVKTFRDKLTNVPAITVVPDKAKDDRVAD